MTALDRLHKYLSRSPSVVFPQDVLTYVDEVKAETDELRKLVSDAHDCKLNEGSCEDCYMDEGECPIEARMRELGIKEQS